MFKSFEHGIFTRFFYPKKLYSVATEQKERMNTNRQ